MSSLLVDDWVKAGDTPSLGAQRRIARPHVMATAPDVQVTPEATGRVASTLQRINRVGGQGDDRRNRDHALRLALGWMEGLTFAEGAIVLGISEENLRRILHGDLSVSGSRFARVEKALEVLVLLRDMVPPHFLAAWFRRPVPALNDKTPLEALRQRQVDDVLRVVRSYFDPSYT